MKTVNDEKKVLSDDEDDGKDDAGDDCYCCFL